MLKTVANSSAKKTGELAVTYRSGTESNCYGTCPDTCALKPAAETGTDAIDWAYFDALMRAVPRRGAAFTYTHFNWRLWSKKWRARLATKRATTTINFSADTWEEAREAVAGGIPTVIAVPAGTEQKHSRVNGVRAIQCPATYLSDVGCIGCGGSVPLCARPNRDYVIVFPGHGAAKKLVGKSSGGCYASGGNVQLHWRQLAKRVSIACEATTLLDFAASLRPGKVLRHHVAGDIGRVK